MSQREKDVWRDIFELYRDLPCLWKTNHDQYHNKDMRSQALSLLYEKYKAFDSDVSLAVFKKKLENMRTSYGRERKKAMKTAMQTGAGSDDVHVPTLWYYELLTFLDEKDIAARKSIETEVSGDEESYSQEPPPKKKKPTTFQKKQEQLLDSTNKILNTKEEDWEIIGRSFGVQLRDLSANQKPIAKKLMSDVIFYGSTGQLTNNSYIFNPSSILKTSQNEYNEYQVTQSPLPPTSQTQEKPKCPKIILKRPVKPLITVTSNSLIQSPISKSFPLKSQKSPEIVSQDEESILDEENRSELAQFLLFKNKYYNNFE